MKTYIIILLLIVSLFSACSESVEDNSSNSDNGVEDVIDTEPNTDGDITVDDEFTITNLPISTNLISNAGFDINIKLGSDVQLNGSMSYHNDLVSLIKYEWELTGKPDGSDVVVSAYETPKPTLKPDVSGVYTFSLVVNDGINKSVPDEMKINVTTTEQNSLPTIIFPYDFLKSNYDYYIKVDEVTFIYGNEAVDLDGDTLSYSYRLIQTPSNSEITEINGAEGNLYIDYFIPDVAGVYKIGATASDGKNTSEESVATIYVTDASTNSKPVVFAKPDKELSSCSFNIEISNGYDGDLGYNPDGLNYRWFTISKPQDSTITYSTQQNYTTDILVDKSGDYVFGVVVNDGMID
ncbi:MAG: hypothetical protein U9P72_06310, partial [Campylobacterota bacterium]|nr:hypothetical protein [Campylobacterota bacterium]